MSVFQLALISAFLLAAGKAQPSSEASPLRINPVVIETGNGPASCPSQDVLESARRNTTATIQQLFQDAPCGGLGWTPVVSLDLGDQSQQCPSPWVEIATPSRSCFAPEIMDSCEGVTFPVSGVTYSRVCGRAIGYASSTPDAFLNGLGQNAGGIDDAYLDGVSVTTHGTPRQHFWSFGAGHGGIFFRCPCDNSDRVQAPLPPSFVGDNYFCDGEYNGALWDGIDCTTSCCTFHSPPWFSVTLPTPTSDDIEVRICSDEVTSNEPTHIRLLEFYVQ